MKRFVAIVWSGTLVVVGTWQVPQSDRPGRRRRPRRRARNSRPRRRGPCRQGTTPRFELAPDQGQPTFFLGDALRKSHPALQARAKSGQAGVAPRDFMTPLVTRNYSYILLHRAAPPQTDQKPAAELHEGVTDVYYIVGGTGTVYVGGEIENRRTSRPGEYLGQIAGANPSSCRRATS